MTLSVNYSITRGTRASNYRVSSNNAHFHVDNSSLTLGKPDLTFHSGTDDKGPIIGTCKFHKLSSSSTISLLNTSSTSRRECLLQSESAWKVQYWFSMKIGDQSKTFGWKRTRSNGKGYKLIDKESKKVFARFLSESTVPPTTGTMQIATTFGPDFELMALMSGLTVIERVGRGSGGPGAVAAAAGGGGGGGGC